MIALKNEERRQLVDLVKDLPELASESSRRELLTLAGLGSLAPMMDLSGSPLIASSTIVSHLAAYGRVASGEEALGHFLNVIKYLTGPERHGFLDDLLIRHQMMTPIIVPRSAASEKEGDEAHLLEKIIGENTLRPIAFLARGATVACAVAYVAVQRGSRRWSGTGFLISPDLLITNQHVVPQIPGDFGMVARFNYEDNSQGEAQPPTEYRPRLGGKFYASTTLDYTVIELDGKPGEQWGWLTLQEQDIEETQRVNIIQHPDGRPKHVALQSNFVQYADQRVIQYVTATLPGSSGSPVFNDAWQVIAVHHAGGALLEPRTQMRYFRNEGIRVSAILRSLPADLMDVLADAPVL